MMPAWLITPLLMGAALILYKAMRWIDDVFRA